MNTKSEWRDWNNHPNRARIYFLLGGPGSGKSTTAQYFSQIQRAALILEWKDKCIHQKYKERAKEVKEIATQNGHWSLSPRIPISIELKDYAQWIGERTKKESIGVLSYLASKISRETEEEVGRRMLKGVISAEKWFIGFDGLDEVPNDVKGSLSNEVIRFIDQLCIECNSDAIFLCTSRPQGYSGQFDELDAITCRLTELDTKHALRCAEPLIRASRTKEESDKGIAILQSAAKSPSVRSLMTTPLQAHIMAVVVRDGKRPPERRWQLFDNFYQVIKRRESNRDLPDIRLARLLREEDQLLKTVHNRLGFVLHARAETSEGAQTSLLRPEFLVVLEKTVSDMKNDHIQETVELLNEATADRLVLVNTPDDGDSLRFDIRPLQEFFSAEFLHDAVDTDQLRSRVSTLAADSHWREVMHYLFSALIEGRRITEVAQIVQIIEEIDSIRLDHSNKELNRRLAVGSSLVSRLIQDGVLEQDKRLRRMFDNSIRPLLGATDYTEVKHLFHLRHKETRAWMIELCMEQIRTAAESESCGAAVLLWNLLDAEEKLIEEFITSLESKSIAYQSIIATSLDRTAADDPYHSRTIIRPPQSHSTLKTWQRNYLLNCVSRENWYELSHNTITSIISSLGRAQAFSSSLNTKNDLIHIKKDLSRKEPYRTLIRFLNYGSYPHTTSSTGKQSNTLNFGFMQVDCPANGWHTGKFHIEEMNTSPLPSKSSPSKGLFTLAEAIWRYCKKPCMSSYNLVSEIIGISPQKTLQAIPTHIHNYIPSSLSNTGEWNNLPKAISKRDYEEKIQQTPKPEEISRGTSEKPTLKQWRQAVSQYHRLANFWMFLDPSHFSSYENENPLLKPPYIRIFVDELIKDPRILSPSYLLGWGILINECPDREVDLRRIFSSIIQNDNHTRRIIEYARSDVIAPFDINIDQNPEFVTPLTQAICMAAERNTRRRLHPSRTGRSFAESIASKFAPNIGHHATPSNIVSQRKQETAYFLLLKLVHPSSNTTLSSVYNDLADTYESDRDCVFLAATLSYIESYFPTPDEFSTKLVSRLLYLAHSDLEHRRYFHRILRLWREASTSPATVADATTKWM